MSRAVAALCLLTAFCAATGGAAQQRYLTAEERAAWSGVGIVTIQGAGRCTGALIRPDVVLTAAHCVADAAARTAQPAQKIYFSAGVADGARVGAAWAQRVEIHPGYFAAGRNRSEAQIRVDFARIILKRPIADAETYRVEPAPPSGAGLALVSYSKGRFGQASIQDGCRVIGRRTEFLQLDCASAPGASGAPYMRLGADGRARIAGIHSGRSNRGPSGKAQALGLDHALDFIGASGGGGGFGGAIGASGALAKPGPTLGETPKKRKGGLLPGGSKPGDRLWRRDD